MFVFYTHTHTKTKQSSGYYFFNNIKSSSDTLTWSWALIHDVCLTVAFCLSVIASINSRCKESNNNERCDPQKLHTQHVNSSRLQGHMLVWNRHQVIEFMCTLGRYSRYMHTNTLINKQREWVQFVTFFKMLSKQILKRKKSALKNIPQALTRQANGRCTVKDSWQLHMQKSNR